MAKNRYGDIPGIKFQTGDAFSLPESFNTSFDMVFEHTLYCAISPQKRDELVRCWRKVLVPQGQVLGVFFVFDRSGGPPFGGSEWELETRLGANFNFLYWTRWRLSPQERQGSELVALAQLKD
jgi:hypothetical protein